MNSVNRGKADESALYGPESGYEEILDQAWLDELRKNLMEWRPWAGDLLDAYLEGDVSSCPGMLAEKYGVSLQTTRKYVRQFEQRLKSFWKVFRFEGSQLLIYNERTFSSALRTLTNTILWMVIAGD